MESTKRDDSFIKSIDDDDYNDNIINTYKKIKQIFPYGGLSVLRLMEALAVAFDITEWDEFEYKDIQNINFDTYIINFLQDYLAGKKVNFSELSDSIYRFGYFSERERRRFKIEKIEERLWAIIMAMTNKNININKK